MVSQGTKTQQEIVSDHLPFILHGVLVGSGSLWPPKGKYF
jgi:hypothetical protein